MATLLQRPLAAVELHHQTHLFYPESFMSISEMGTAANHQNVISTVDLLSMDASELQSCLVQKKFTSVQLVHAQLEQIRKHDHQGVNLHAMISTAPEKEVVKLAAKLDEERAAGKIRGPLHGITIIVKVRNATRAAHQLSSINLDRMPLQPTLL